MDYLFSRLHRDVLAQFAWSNVLLAFDFDGTLSPLVPRPQDARLPPSTHRLLGALGQLYPCAVISGRARDDVAGRLSDLPLFAVVGNHGLEPSHSEGRFRRTVSRWLPRLRAGLGGVQGLAIEDKQLSVAIHYRKSRAKRAAQATIREVAAGLGPLRWVSGKLVVNLLPPGAPHKGLALEALRRQAGCDTAVYVGDDETDEDVFALARPGRLLGVRVGRKSGSLAHYYLRGQPEVDRLLETLRDLRAARPAERKARSS